MHCFSWQGACFAPNNTQSSFFRTTLTSICHNNAILTFPQTTFPLLVTNMGDFFVHLQPTLQYVVNLLGCGQQLISRAFPDFSCDCVCVYVRLRMRVCFSCNTHFCVFVFCLCACPMYACARMFVDVQSFPSIAPFGPYSTAAALTFVVGVSAVKAATEDYVCPLTPLPCVLKLVVWWEFSLGNIFCGFSTSPALSCPPTTRRSVTWFMSITSTSSRCSHDDPSLGCSVSLRCWGVWNVCLTHMCASLQGRFRRDKEVNHRFASVYGTTSMGGTTSPSSLGFQQTHWKDVRVGDIVRIQRDQKVRFHSLYIASSHLCCGLPLLPLSSQCLYAACFSCLALGADSCGSFVAEE